MLSKRIQQVESSGIRKIFDLAAGGKGGYIDFSIGMPDFEAPHALKEAAIKAIRDNNNSYTPTVGLQSLREKIAGKLKDRNQIAARPEDIVITGGTSGGILLAMSAILDPGDEIILPDPYFLSYYEVAKFLGAKPLFLDTYPDFRIHPERLAGLITPRTRAIVLNSPANPTGIVMSKSECETVAAIAAKNNLLIISDEIYEDFDYEGKFFSIGSVYPATVTLNGFSKSLAVTGWRIGYAHGPAEIVKAMATLQQYSYMSASSVAQFALDSAWSACDEDKARVRSEYKIKRDLAYAMLKDRFEMNLPEGAFYAFAKFPAGVADFIDKAIKQGVLIVPGEVFSQKRGYFRLSYAVPPEKLEQGIGILKAIK